MTCLLLPSCYVQKFYPLKRHKIHLSPFKRNNALTLMKTSQPSAYLQPLLLVIRQFFNLLRAIWFLSCWLECLAQLKPSPLTPGRTQTTAVRIACFISVAGSREALGALSFHCAPHIPYLFSHFPETKGKNLHLFQSKCNLVGGAQH